MVWALYLLLLAGAFTGVAQVVRMAYATRRAGQPKPGWHEDLP
jgi:hypothetical protein